MSGRIKAIHLSPGYSITCFRSVHSKCTFPCNAAWDLLRNSAEVFVSAKHNLEIAHCWICRCETVFYGDYFDTTKLSYTSTSNYLVNRYKQAVLYIDNIKLSYISILTSCVLFRNYQTVLYIDIINCLIYRYHTVLKIVIIILSCVRRHLTVPYVDVIRLPYISISDYLIYRYY